MTDHIEQAAAKAVDLAEELNDERGDTLSVKAAAHLTYMAGLLRGSTGPSEVTLANGDRLVANSVEGPRRLAGNFRTSAAKVLEGRNPHGDNWAAGVRHGYLQAADALDEVADAYETVRDQRDELRRAIGDFLKRVEPDQGDMRLHGALAQVEREIEARDR